jgi:FtsH-binding integral membrane protein
VTGRESIRYGWCSVARASSDPRRVASLSEAWHGAFWEQGERMDRQQNPQPWTARAGTAPVIVASAPVEARAAFITRTYLHLLLAIVAFTMLEVLWFVTPVANGVFRAMSTSRFVQLAMIGAFIGVGYLADRWARTSTSKGMQYAGLGLFVAAESVLFLPLIGTALMLGAQGEPGILSKAAVITLMMFSSLTGVVFVTRKDFSFLRGVLLFGGLAALGLVVVSLLFGFSLGMFFSYAMVVLACGYILYDTSNVMLHYRTNQHVAAALALFASVMLLFWYVLRILIDRRR